MPKLKTCTISVYYDGSHLKDKLALRFDIEVHVGAAGDFYTHLPEKIVNQLLKAGVDLDNNGRRNGKMGYFSAETLGVLLKRVEDKCQQFASRKMLSETMIIRYAINTVCSYFLVKGEYYPNGGWIDYTKHKWREGNDRQRFDGSRAIWIQRGMRGADEARLFVWFRDTENGIQ